MQHNFFAYRTPFVLAALLALAAFCAFAPHITRTSQAQSNLFVTTFAGIPQAGFSDGQGPTARFNAPLGICVDANDNIIVADFRNARIRRIDPQGNVTTIAGSTQGFANGYGTAARFYGPAGVAVDRRGNILVADYSNNRIRQIDPTTGLVTTIAGSGTYGSLNGSAFNARLARPTGIVVDNNDNIYVLDSGTNLVRKIDATRYVSTLAVHYNKTYRLVNAELGSYRLHAEQTTLPGVRDGKKVETRIDTGAMLVTPENMDKPEVVELLKPNFKELLGG